MAQSPKDGFYGTPLTIFNKHLWVPAPSALKPLYLIPSKDTAFRSPSKAWRWFRRWFRLPGEGFQLGSPAPLRWFTWSIIGRRDKTSARRRTASAVSAVRRGCGGSTGLRALARHLGRRPAGRGGISKQRMESFFFQSQQVLSDK